MSNLYCSPTGTHEAGSLLLLEDDEAFQLIEGGYATPIQDERTPVDIIEDVPPKKKVKYGKNKTDNGSY